MTIIACGTRYARQKRLLAEATDRLRPETNVYQPISSYRR